MEGEPPAAAPVAPVRRRIRVKTGKIATIEKVYYDEATGYRNIKDTWKAAKALDATITEKDVKDWKTRLEAPKKQLPGYNSFIASKPFEEFQIDLLFFTQDGAPEPKAEVKKLDEEQKVEEDKIDKEEEEEEKKDKELPAKEVKAKRVKKEKPKLKYVPGMIMVDTFTKYCTIVILPGGKKDVGAVTSGMLEGMANMLCNEPGNHQPRTIYSDNEPALTSRAVQAWFRENKIRHLTTQGHAPVAERTIRTIKAINDARRKAPANRDRDWKVVLQESVKAYNDVHAHRAIGMTPKDARLPANAAKVKENLEATRVATRKYPDLNVGDKVRLYHKKNQLDKERVALWSDIIYEVEEIEPSMGQNLYKINNGKDHKYLRGELLKIN